MGKTECVLFVSKRKLRKIDNFLIECIGHTIKAQRSVKYLGLNLDDQLTGETIVTCNSIVKKSMVDLNFFTGNAAF